MIKGKACSWRNPKIVLTLALIFLCGAFVGMLGMSFGLQKLRPTQIGWNEGGKEVSLEKFKQDLALTPAQAEQLETVLDDYFMYYHSIQAQLNDVRSTGKGRILRILNEEQRDKFNRMMMDVQARKELR